MDEVTRIASEWWLLAILGVVSLIAGVLAIVYPDETLLVIGLIFGCYLLLAGIFELLNAVVGDPESRALTAIVGIIALVAGLVCLRRPGESLLALIVVVGIYLVVAGAVKLVLAFTRAEDRGWVALSAIGDLVLGILILALPDLSLTTLAVLFGISLVLRGVFALVAAFKLRKVHKEGADLAPPFGAAPA
jgi:uncharacterized membrane protein HdeD (DUF308 family)